MWIKWQTEVPVRFVSNPAAQEVTFLHRNKYIDEEQKKKKISKEPHLSKMHEELWCDKKKEKHWTEQEPEGSAAVQKMFSRRVAVRDRQQLCYPA